MQWTRTKVSRTVIVHRTHKNALVGVICIGTKIVLWNAASVGTFSFSEQATIQYKDLFLPTRRDCCGAFLKICFSSGSFVL